MSINTSTQYVSNGPPTRVVFVGAGHSHVEALRRLGMHPATNIRLTLISSDYHAPYSGMLPGLVAGHYDFDQTHIDVAPLAQFAGCTLLHDRVVNIDLEAKQVLCDNRPPVPFDLLSINVGSTPQIADVPGASEFALCAKPVDKFLAAWAKIREKALNAHSTFRFLVIGGGAGGVELALTMHHHLTTQHSNGDSSNLEFDIATDTGDILPTHNRRVRAYLNRVLKQRGIRTHLSHRATRVTADEVEFSNDVSLPYDILIWVTSAAPAQWVRQSGLDTDRQGFIAVDETLRSTSHPFVFAAGDIATMIDSPRPKSGVFAVRQGPYLYQNIVKTVDHQPLEKFKPQKHFLSLISTGDKNAIASRGRWAWEGPLLWRWKDHIDVKFMDKYRDLEAMPMSNGQMNAPQDMHCGGCGCKLGGVTLSSVLERLRAEMSIDQAKAFDHPDDAAIIEVPPGKLAVRTVDFFRSFVDDPYVFGQIAAHHCLSDIYAMGASPHDALATVTIPYAAPRDSETILYDLLAGALKILDEEKTSLVGGHTTEGPDLSFGLSVTGYVDESKLMRKGGMKPGDCLILTKPIGTGVIFAAHMHGKARGRWIEAAIESMLVSNKAAAQTLHEFGATSCTDITGFGLAGHLLEMLRESKTSADLDPSVIPTIDGAAAASEEGHASTLYPQNARYASALADWSKHEADPLARLLFDPQTSGGLLASVAREQAESCIEALRDCGYASAAIIGTCAEQPNTENLITLMEIDRTNAAVQPV